tara:strand:- start:437 stop:994 length:558 start_codon:yes stop_codon:yes gene_type:complete
MARRKQYAKGQGSSEGQEGPGNVLHTLGDTVNKKTASIKTRHEEKTLIPTIALLLSITLNVVYVIMSKAYQPVKDDATDKEKADHNQVVSFSNVFTIMINIMFLVRTYFSTKHACGNRRNGKLHATDKLTMLLVLLNNLGVIYCNMRNEPTNSRTFILIVTTLSILVAVFLATLYMNHKSRDDMI